MIERIQGVTNTEPTLVLQKTEATGAFWEVANKIREVAIEILKNPIVQDMLEKGIDKAKDYAKERVKEALGETPPGGIDVAQLAFEVIDMAAKQAKDHIKK